MSLQKNKKWIFITLLVWTLASRAQDANSTEAPLFSDEAAEAEIYNTPNSKKQLPMGQGDLIIPPTETAPLEPPYNGVEAEEFQNLENSIEQVTPTVRKPVEPVEENYTQENLSENSEKWKIDQRVPEPSRLKELNEKEGLRRITKKGEFVYDVEPSPQNSAASFRVGTFEGPNLANPNNGRTFQEVYGEDTKIILLGDYEWQFYKKFGKLGLKVGSGLMLAQGYGIFTDETFFDFDDDGTAEVATEAEERYSLFVFPNNLAIIYRAQFFDKQWLVPFAEAGIDYIALIEYRDDGNETNFGGSPHFHIALGGSFSLSSLSKDLALSADKEYGVNSMWLTAEYRRLELISGNFDFSDDIYAAGFMFEF